MNRLPDWARRVICLIGAVAFLLGMHRLSLQVNGALLVASVVIVTWSLNWKWSLSLTCLWLVATLLNSTDQAWQNMAAHVISAGIAFGLMVWTAWLQRRFAEEHRRARTDLLTGLPNRHAFDEQLAAELSRSKRFNRPFTLMLLDGDQFKAINDRHGHAAGDRALELTGQILIETVRRYDVVARLGGDEFAILLPETNSVEAETVAQRLQQAFAARLEPAFPPLTYSFGIVTFFPGDWTIEACLVEADRVLYRAKQSGKKQLQQESLGETIEPTRH